MITKNDCILLLTQLQKEGVDTSQMLLKTVKNTDIQLDVLEFINDIRPLSIKGFYEKMRASYNNNNSKLYINIMKEFDETKMDEILSTLNSYALQAAIYAKSVDNKSMFYKHARLDEVYSVLLQYVKNFDLTNCIKLLRLIKADIKALESTYRK